MFCARCGQQIPDASETCPLCGRETTIKLPPQPSIATAAAPAAVRSQGVRTVVQGPHGVGGWLLLFCFTITIVRPLVLAGQLAFTGLWLNQTNLFRISVVVYGTLVGGFLWMQSSRALSLLRVYFGIAFVVAFIYLLELIVSGPRVGWASVFRAERFQAILYSMAYTVLWFAYFRRSQRVRNTYGTNL